MQEVSLADQDIRNPADLHGVGASVTNALSEWLEVEIYRDGKIHRQRFEYWMDENGMEHVGEPSLDLK